MAMTASASQIVGQTCQWMTTKYVSLSLTVIDSFTSVYYTCPSLLRWFLGRKWNYRTRRRLYAIGWWVH
jgi:hypothetical protein